MTTPATLTTLPGFSENQRTALVKLLADDDPMVYQAVRKKLLSSGAETGEWLRPYVLSNDPVLRRHAREIVRHFDGQEADTRFLAFCLRHGEAFDLEKSAWLLAQTEFPDINIEAYGALLDSYAEVLRERIGSSAEPDDVLAIINEFIFDDLGYAGDEEHASNPDSGYLNRVVDQRTGSPVTLCLFYLLLGRRLRLPIAGISLPGHFLCRYQSSSTELYLDVFHGGRFLSKTDCVQYLLRGHYSLREDFLSPVTSRRVLMRICAQLHKIYLRRRAKEKATRLQRYLIALAR